MARKGENIRKRADGRWEARFSVYNPDTGRKKTKSLYAKTYADAKAKLVEAKYMASRNSLTNHSSGCAGGEDKKVAEVSAVLLTDIAEAWLMEVSRFKKHSTYIKYKGIYEKHIAAGLEGISLCDISGNQISKLLEAGISKDRDCSHSLIKSIYCVGNKIMDYCNTHYQANLQKAQYPKGHMSVKPVKILIQSEQVRLFREIYRDMDLDKLGILLCLTTGLRLGEICALKWSDIDIHGKLLYVNRSVQRIAMDGFPTKTILREDNPKSLFSRREIPLPDDIMPYLAAFRQDSGYVVAGDKPMEPRTYQYRFQRLLSDAGIEKHNFHEIRHTFATNCINSGIDPKSLSEILGHSDVDITLNRYVHPSVDTKRRHLNQLSTVYGQYVGQENP